MKFIIQRVTSASVEVEGKVVGNIDKGFFVLIGVTDSDTTEIADKMIKKLLGMRIFADEEGKTNLSLASVGGSLLLVSQFTLYADCRKGNRPSFIKSGSPEHAEKMYDYIVEKCRDWAESQNEMIRVETGIFGAEMKCSLVNDGPFTIDLNSNDL
ncbi:MAG: D-tyrosyl-tRNA(Tyr) deacylase [Eubacterium sp.]|nr:D-tyrosyl-tRNA(Tyr) deacylase [Eubacterium sp.]